MKAGCELDALAAVFHDAWASWAKAILIDESISDGRKERWETYFVPYDDLDEKAKEQDRIWARAALKTLEQETYYSMC